MNFTLLNLGIGIGGMVGGLFVDVDRVETFQAIYLADAASYLPAIVSCSWSRCATPPAGSSPTPGRP